VLAGAAAIEVSTWDGHSLDAGDAAVGVVGDLGVAHVDGALPMVGRFGSPPKAGDVVTAVGYPLAQQLTLSTGTVVDRVDGSRLGIPGEVIRLAVRVEHGNSGGPLLDQNGRIIGIVYAYEISTGFGLAIPVDTLQALVRSGGFEPVPPCGSE
jgi:S1-C subfamily serine protease